MKTVIRALSAALGVLANVRSLSAQLPVEAVVSRTRFGYYEMPALSRDGGLVAYVVRNPDPHLKVTNIVTGSTQTIDGGARGSWGPAWSPDGRQLAFVSNRDGPPHLSVWSRETGKVRRVTPTPISGISRSQTPVWMPDGKNVLVTTIRRGGRPVKSETRAADTIPRIYRSVPAFPLSPRNNMFRDTAGSSPNLRDLVKVDVATSKVSTLISKARIDTWSLSPDGRTAALVLGRGTLAPMPKKSVTWLYDIETLDLPSGRRTVVARDIPGMLAVSFSPDSRLLAFVNYEWGPWARGDCWVAVVGGEARNVTPGTHENFSRNDRGPLWDRDGHALYLEGDSILWRMTIDEHGEAGPLTRAFGMTGETLLGLLKTNDGDRAWSPDSGRSIVVVTRHFATQGLRLYTVETGSGASTLRYTASQLLGEEDMGLRQLYAVASTSANRLVFRAEDMEHPQDLWLLDGRNWKARQLTHLNLALERPLPGARLIEWHDFSGRPRRGALMLPAGYTPGRRYPLVVYEYPILDLSASINRFGGQDAGGLINLHLLTTRGYAVLLPDVMGVKPLPDTALIEATWRAIGNGVARAIELGFADSNQLAIMGHSFGGYGVLSTLVSTGQFRTGVALSGGYYNLPAKFGQMQADGSSIYTKTLVYNMGCTLWECPARYVANSPLFFLNRMTASLLLVNGTEDPAAQPSQSDQVFVALQTLGREVEYAKYPGEGHDYSTWTRAHQRDVVRRVLRWLDAQLCSRPGDPPCSRGAASHN